MTPHASTRRKNNLDEADLGAGPALFRLVRFWSRRWASRVAEQHLGDADHVPHILVVEALDTAANAQSEVTVADVAYQLGLDRSVASRMTTAAVTADYVRRETSAHDRRRATLAITAAGRDLLAASHTWQQQVFDDLVSDWDPTDQEKLAAYVQRLARSVLPNEQQQSHG